MDSDRASKRRKLDTQDSKSRSKKSKTPAPNAEKDNTVATTNGDHIDDDDDYESAARVAKENWEAAKANVLASKKKKSAPPAKDIYDDIDGAHAPPTAKKVASVPRERDPLRNQRQESQSSPVKKGAPTLGFFKQFHKPKADGLERKKTFEDEIRELEEQARREVVEEEDGGPGAVARRRSSGRHSKELDELEIEDSEEERKVVPKSAPVSRMSAPKRKQKTVAKEKSRQSAEPQEAVISQDVAASLSTPTKTKTQARKPSQSKQKPVAFEAEDLRAVQSTVLEQLTGKRPIPLLNLGDEFAKVSQLVTQTITAGESNSMLLIGARGSGKTALVNQIIREQAIEHPHDFHVVRLNGFIHTDDKIALREIWRQLGREMALEEEEESLSKNYADTLATLLALLSHPAEQGLEQPDQVSRSVIFILDEFELFANHPRQTLLYNLFDIAQSRKAPIAVLGLTTRVDVAESLEKRVKSRFSHRYVHLSLAKSFAAFADMCKSTLALPDDTSIAPDAVTAWNQLVDALLLTPAFQRHLHRIYYTTKSISDFTSSLLVAVATSPINDTSMDAAALTSHFTTALTTSCLAPPDSKLDLLASLSTLQLALLICATRLSAIYNTDLVSFNLVYEEYKVLASKAKLQASASGAMATGSRVSGKGVARDAWEGVLGLGLVVEDGRGGGGGGGRVDVGLEEIGWSGVELGGWGRWCREI